MNFKPMLSASLDGVDLSTLNYPGFVSPKLDGLRCIVWDGVAYSRNAKPFRNHFLQAWAKDYHNIDGEIIVGPPTGGLVLERSKAITAFAGEPDFTFHLFDTPDGISDSFAVRRKHVAEQHGSEPRISIVPHYHIWDQLALLAWEKTWLDEGYEGLMWRHPSGPYKHGRSTLKEGWLMKLKRFTDGEALVTGFEEAQENTNPLQKDELGRAKRSGHRDGMVGKGMVGTILCHDPVWGTIRVAPGIMDYSERTVQWRLFQTAPQKSILGKTIHWRSFGYGTKDAPRFARYYGVKEEV